MSERNFDTYRKVELAGKTPGLKVMVAFGCDEMHHAIDVDEAEFEGEEVVYAIHLHTSVVGLCDKSCSSKKRYLGHFRCEVA